MDTKPQITKAEFLAGIEKIVAEMPDAKNPLNPETLTCLYEDPVTKDHCLIGEYLHRHDPATLAEARTVQYTDVNAAGRILANAGYPQPVASLAGQLQVMADEGSNTDSLRPWSKVMASFDGLPDWMRS